MRNLHLATMWLSGVALTLIVYITVQDSCSWGWRQHAGTIAIATLIGMTMSSALRSLDARNTRE